MMKRSGSFEKSSAKKAKFEDLDDLWGDDFDSEAVDDCFNQATQVCQNEEKVRQQQQNNVSFMVPSYNSFMESKNVISSTQHNGNVNMGLEVKVRQLQVKCEEKEGEASILRSNLKELRGIHQAELEKKQEEWKQKFISLQKENGAIRSELDFKNLEVANLKQRNVEIQKKMLSEKASKQIENATKVLSPVKSHTRVDSSQNTKIHANFDCSYPLKNVIFDATSDTSQYFYSGKVKYKSHKNTIPYLQNQMFKDEADFFNSLKRNHPVINEKKLNLNYINQEVSVLISLSLSDIQSEKAIPAINKIVCVMLQFLSDFHDYLTRLERRMETHEAQQADSLFLKENNAAKFSKNPQFNGIQMGVMSGKLVQFVAEVLPYSPYLSNYLLRSTKLNLDCSCEYVRALPNLLTTTSEPFRCLKLLLGIVTIIGRIRKTPNCSLFVSAVTKLLLSIFKCQNENKSFELSLQVTRELLFARPGFEIILQMAQLFKVASTNPNFVKSLCSTPTRPAVKTSFTKGISYFTSESCLFHMFSILFENMLSKMENDQLPLSVSLDLLVFVQNIFRANPVWVNQQDDKKCECIEQLHKLSIGITYKNLKRCRHSTNPDLNTYYEFSHHAIRVLGLLTFNSFDFIEQFVTVYAQFKEIVDILIKSKEELKLNQFEVSELENLDLNEEMPEIPQNNFVNVNI